MLKDKYSVSLMLLDLGYSTLVLFNTNENHFIVSETTCTQESMAFADIEPMRGPRKFFKKR